ncbi:hypothetical protein CHISP_1301 [Chitinispirillum alkaliphilum]|nr:hypothetical protein CHISP_1301 [Chitinispirillum alkaliphilum]
MPKMIFLAGCVILYLLRKITDGDIYYFALLVMMALTINSWFFYIRGKVKKKGQFLKRIKDSRLHRYILSVLILSWFVIFFLMSVGKYHSYNCYMSDLGHMDQAIWNTTQGRLLEVTSQTYPFGNRTRLSGHVEPVYLIFALIYTISPDPRLLLLSKLILLSLSILLIYKIADELLGDKLQACTVATVFALFPSLQFIALYDFYGDSLSIPFLLMAYLCYIKKKSMWYFVFIIAALLCKEYVSLAVAGLGVSLALMHGDKKTGAITFIVGSLYFSCVNWYVIPIFNRGQESFLIEKIFGDIGGEGGVAGIIMFALRNPLSFLGSMITRQNMENGFYLLFPLFMIPFRSVGYLCGFLPILFKDLLAGLDIYNHRPAIGLPFLFIAFMYGVKRETGNEKLKKGISTGNLLQLALIASMLATFMYGPSPLGHRFWRETEKYIPDEHSKAADYILKKIPDEVTIAVSAKFAPHLTHRQYCFLFPNAITSENSKLQEIEYICVDSTAGKSLMTGDTSFSSQTIPRIESLGFKLQDEKRGIHLFRRKRYVGEFPTP